VKENLPDNDSEAAEFERQLKALTNYEAELRKHGPKGSWKFDIDRYNRKTGELLPLKEQDREERVIILRSRRLELESSKENPVLKEIKLNILRMLQLEYTTQFHNEHENKNYES
jgi:hypothetical protein